MGKPVLSAVERDMLGKNSAHKSRRYGYIPAVLYNENKNKYLNLHLSDTLEVLKKHGDSAVVEVKMDDSATSALIKEVQRDPITKDVLHIDLKPITANERIAAKVPVNFTNTENIIKQKGIIQTQKNFLEIECNAENVPKVLNIDASKYTVGQALRVNDIEIAGEISILDGPNEIIANIVKSNNLIES